MSSTLTSQYPCTGMTSTQKRSESMCSSLMDPNVISDCSRSELDKKTENNECRNTECDDWKRPIKLNDFVRAKFGKANPRMPSKVKSSNGSLLSSTVAMKPPVLQAWPTQILSSRQKPVMWPTPKLILIGPGSSPSLRCVPSHFILLAVVEASGSKLACESQASLSHSLLGTSRFPLAVSKSTTNSCGGVPIDILPWYDVLWTTLPAEAALTFLVRSVKANDIAEPEDACAS
mmetsp:Transcript_13702/g.34705  ORF Transcript_13702/g.34705 Transcript_13702/m.34705 type:complete len:232 (-) Transcript_13702:152-847(-)